VIAFPDFSMRQPGQRITRQYVSDVDLVLSFVRGHRQAVRRSRSEWTERFCKAAGLACRFDFPLDGGDFNVPARARHELLLVLKESLANTSKYAVAHTVNVGSSLDQTHASLTVRDDGRGFDVTHKNGGSGLQNLRERVQQVGGRFSLESQLGQGTVVRAWLPLTRPEPEKK
jgi:signal transduction histidine kinase